MKFPGGEQTVAADSRLNFDHARRSKVGPGEFFFARPHQLDRLAHRFSQTRGFDGVMIGRGIFGNPWLFNEEVQRSELPLKEVLGVMLEHTALYIELLGEFKPLDLMKKHFKAYVSGFEGAGELRGRLMDAVDFQQIKAIVRSV